MGQTFWIIVVLCASVVSALGMLAVLRMGTRAYTQGAAPGAPEAFTSFASQLLRITTVIAIVAAALIISLKGELPSSVAGILSGIAGYVLGGTEKTAAPKAPTQQPITQNK